MKELRLTLWICLLGCLIFAAGVVVGRTEEHKKTVVAVGLQRERFAQFVAYSMYEHEIPTIDYLKDFLKNPWPYHGDVKEVRWADEARRMIEAVEP